MSTTTYTLRILGIGPVPDRTYTWDRNGQTTITGPSRSGKTTLRLALCGILAGKLPDKSTWPGDISRIRSDSEHHQATLTTPKGGIFGVRWTPSKVTALHSVAIDGVPQKPTPMSHQDLRAKLGKVSDPDLILTIVDPDYWRDLGRLTTTLSAALPGPSAAELLETELRPGEPRQMTTTAKTGPGATDLRRDANAALTAAEAALAEATRNAGLLTPPEAPDPALVLEAEQARAAVQAREQERAAHAPKVQAWTADNRAWQARIAEQSAWDAWRSVLVGPIVAEPGAGAVDAYRRDADAEVATQAEAAALAIAERRSWLAAADTRASKLSAAARLDQWRRSLAAIPPEPAESCPGAVGCLRLTDARAARQAAIDALEPEPSDPGPVADLPPEPLAHVEVTEARDRLARITAAQTAWTTYRQRIADRGERPADAPDPGPRPEAPEAITLSAEHAAILRRRDGYPDALRQHEAQARAAAVRVGELAAKAAAAKAAAERASVVHDLVKTAAGRALAPKIGMLGQTGPVELRVSDDGALSVLIRGMALDTSYGGLLLVSSGLLLACSAVLRAAIRRAVGGDWLPIVVDGVQDLAGEDEALLAAVPGPVILLRTGAA